MKVVLGISAYYHDSAATLTIGEEIVAAVQEERFSREKHDPRFPFDSILFCLKAANIKPEQIDAVVFYDKPFLKFERLLETYLANTPFGLKSFLSAMPIWLKEKLYLKSVLRRELKSVFQAWSKENQSNKLSSKIPTLLFTEHHQSHAASAFYPSPFESAVVICIDGVGEWATTSIWQGKGEQLSLISEINFPHSLGLLYSSFTYYCGFKVNSGEYKLMGLAPYGNPTYVEKIKSHLIDIKSDGSFSLAMEYFDFPTGRVMTTSKFNQLFGGSPRQPESEIGQKEMDLARSIQVVVEEVILRIAKYAKEETGEDNLCLAGGVALNCVANGELQRRQLFKNIWIQPAAGDAGGSLGAALVAQFDYFSQKRSVKKSHKVKEPGVQIDLRLSDTMKGSFLGPEFSQSQIEETLKSQNLNYQQFLDGTIYTETAKRIDSQQVVGWFQGRMEFGPRALGHRSIIGDPRSEKMQAIMNLKIKKRESFRPFAPAVLAEDVSEYFETQVESPYMLFVHPVKESIRFERDESSNSLSSRINQVRSTLPAITHLDYSARIQTVHSDSNPYFYHLLSAFKSLTGTSVLINTSFNVRGEPPVCTPEDAINCFFNTEMDVLVLGEFMLLKSENKNAFISNVNKVPFKLD